MKILFLTYHGFEESSGISKKMQAQIKGLRQNGHEVHLCYYDITSNGDHCRYVDKQIIKNYGKGRWATIRQRIEYGCIYDYCNQNGIQLVYVRCFMNASPFNIRLFQRLHSSCIKTLMEVPTYPYDKEMETLPFKYRFEHVFDKLFRRKLSSYMDAIITFTNEKEIFGKRTICISNGVDFDRIPLHQPSDIKHQPSALHLIGVAEVHPWHGFDRLIAGLGEYYYSPKLNDKDHTRDVYFHIVGGIEKDMMCRFKQIIEQYHIEPYVIFHGKLFGNQLDEVFAQCQFAIGSLARHRSGITHIKTLKNREYAARGIPFVYSECDSDFEGQPYIIKAAPDESPINIQSIVDFMEHFDMQPGEIRNTIEKLSWKYQMQRVLEQC
jgi:glycosyltransferase involved in cell wall biosynthesis